MNDTQSKTPSRHRGAMASVLAMSALQIVVFVITMIVWLGLHLAHSGGECGATCDWAQVTQASVLYLGVVGVSFAGTATAAIVSYRTGRDLMWVPFVGTGLIVIGYFAAAALYNQAMAT